MTFISN